MNIINGAIIGFVILETLNILMLYFVPNTKKGNGVGVFKAYEQSKEHEEFYDLIRYLINWVAGTKLIFIALLIVIVIVGNETTRILSAAVMIPTIATFYWRLYPIMKAIDHRGMIEPKGYSKTLGIMIAGFIGVFVIALVIGLMV